MVGEGSAGCTGAGAGCGGAGVGVGGGGATRFRASSVFLSTVVCFGGRTGLICTLGWRSLMASGSESRYVKSLRFLIASMGSITCGTLNTYFGIQVNADIRMR